MDELDEVLKRSQYRYFEPLTTAADEYVHWAQTPERRVYLHVPQLDRAMRGTAPSQLTGVVGYTHSFKTQLMTHMVINSPERNVAWVTPDESRMAVVVKLTSNITGYSARELEAMLDDPEREKEAKTLLYATAEDLPNLFVCDYNLDLNQMWDACEEYQQAKGQAVEVVIFDFARLLKVEGDERAKLEALKIWTNEHKLSTFVIHQTSRGSGRDGEPIDISSGAFGGEDVYTHMIGVRRKVRWYESLLQDAYRAYEQAQGQKREDLREKIEEYELARDAHQDTVTINLVKNKVPPCELVPEFDLTIDPRSGRLLV